MKRNNVTSSVNGFWSVRHDVTRKTYGCGVAADRCGCRWTSWIYWLLSWNQMTPRLRKAGVRAVLRLRRATAPEPRRTASETATTRSRHDGDRVAEPPSRSNAKPSTHVMTSRSRRSIHSRWYRCGTAASTLSKSFKHDTCGLFVARLEC